MTKGQSEVAKRERATVVIGGGGLVVVKLIVRTQRTGQVCGTFWLGSDVVESDSEM